MNSYMYQDTQNAKSQGLGARIKELSHGETEISGIGMITATLQPSTRDEIQFFVEMLKTPNLDQSTISYINETIQLLLHQYNHGSFLVKVEP